MLSVLLQTRLLSLVKGTLCGVKPSGLGVVFDGEEGEVLCGAVGYVGVGSRIPSGILS